MLIFIMFMSLLLGVAASGPAQLVGHSMMAGEHLQTVLLNYICAGAVVAVATTALVLLGPVPWPHNAGREQTKVPL